MPATCVPCPLPSRLLPPTQLVPPTTSSPDRETQRGRVTPRGRGESAPRDSYTLRKEGQYAVLNLLALSSRRTRHFAHHAPGAPLRAGKERLEWRLRPLSSVGRAPPW